MGINKGAFRVRYSSSDDEEEAESYCSGWFSLLLVQNVMFREELGTHDISKIYRFLN
jgi:hypothetical protein